MPKGVNCPEQVNRNFILSYDSFDEELFNMLPDFIKNKMMTSVEYQAVKNPHSKSFTDQMLEDNEPVPF